MSESRSNLNNTITLEAKEVVVIGDGPAALVAAIQLNQANVNVTLVGPRLGKYVRSGDHVPEVIDVINQSITPQKIINTPSRHIKDVEKQLYLIVEKLGIPQIKAAFYGFVSANVIAIKGENNQIKHIPAQLLYDATGTARAVIKKANETDAHHPKFTLTPIEGNPHKSYALIRAIMSNKDLDAFEAVRYNPNDLPPLAYVDAMEKLHALGWKNFSPPHLYGNILPKKIRNPNDPENPAEFKIDQDFNKVNLYFQIPDTMERQEDILRFANILLELGNTLPENLESPCSLKIQDESKKSGKPMVSRFEVDPVIVTPGYYLGDEIIPPIFHIGDATCNLPFVSGQGIIRGISRYNILTSALTYKDDKAILNTTSYNEIFSLTINHVYNYVLDIYSRIYHNHIDEHTEIALEIYHRALEQSYQSPDEEKNKPLQNIIETRLANEDPTYFYIQFTRAMEPIEEQKKYDNFPSAPTIQQQYLERAFHWGEKAHILKNQLYQHEQIELNTATAKLAEEYNFLGNRFIQRNIITKAITCYNNALTLYNFLGNTFLKEIITLYSNLIIAYTKAMDFDKVIELATEVQNAHNLSLKNKESGDSREKIFYYKALALINKIDRLLLNKHSVETIQPMLVEVKDIIDS